MGIRIDNRADFSSDQLATMSEGLDRMSCPASAEVVICDDFVSEVRNLLSSTTYDTARGTNVVAAKTIPVSDDCQVIVVNAEPVRGLELAQLGRLLAHEAGHALIHSRMEGHPDLDLRSPQMGEQVLYALATTALDEYRVERAVYAQGFPLAQEVDWPAAGQVATDVNLDVMEAVVDKTNANDVERLAGDIAAVHNWSSKKMAYIAAAVAADAMPGTVDVLTEQQVDWADYLEGTWSHRLAAYRLAPDASSPASADQLRRIVAKLLTVERHYLTAMGFFYREYRDTWGFHRRKDNSLFAARFERAARVVMERAGSE
ncbi:MULTISPECIES: hypothetical protein [Gordonia]|uniref:Uncharacterized protein n=1 Tax=Gordonia aquimaris TaxID=2984863 RepID=A0A9X3I7E1_9ACTN|nr:MULTISPECIES: hypothetical protein [Gordonia]MCX2966479.1 hypothetical protein [Gordonia aquimaris]